MSLDKVKKVKKDRGFKIWDALVYGAIALLVIALFIAVFFTRDTSPLRGVRIYVDNVAVFEYDFESGEYAVTAEDGVQVESAEDVLTVTISAGGGYNVVTIEKSGSVRVAEADCGNKACVFMAAIEDNNGIIYCSPHKLKIVPYSYDPDDGNIKI